LMNYVIKYHYPEIEKKEVEEEEKWVLLFGEIVKRTARMVAEWQCVGFTHGVMNTDNMSILGLTIDYGPFGFLDSYNPDFISNATDQEGRYSFKNQPFICKWNLEKLYEVFSILLEKNIGKNWTILTLNIGEFISQKCETSWDFSKRMKKMKN